MEKVCIFIFVNRVRGFLGFLNFFMDFSGRIFDVGGEYSKIYEGGCEGFIREKWRIRRIRLGLIRRDF